MSDLTIPWEEANVISIMSGASCGYYSLLDNSTCVCCYDPCFVWQPGSGYSIHALSITSECIHSLCITCVQVFMVAMESCCNPVCLLDMCLCFCVFMLACSPKLIFHLLSSTNKQLLLWTDINMKSFCL